MDGLLSTNSPFFHICLYPRSIVITFSIHHDTHVQTDYGCSTSSWDGDGALVSFVFSEEHPDKLTVECIMCSLKRHLRPRGPCRRLTFIKRAEPNHVAARLETWRCRTQQLCILRRHRPRSRSVPTQSSKGGSQRTPSTPRRVPTALASGRSTMSGTAELTHGRRCHGSTRRGRR